MASPDCVSFGAITVPDAARGMGVRVVAGKGSGKSRLIGRTLVVQDFAKGIPTLVIDPTQALINNVLDKIIRMPLPVQQAAFRRICYINLAGEPDPEGTVRVVPFPILYPARTPYDAAQRFPDVMERIDPALRSAPMLGIEALRNIATDVGSVLYALGWQYSEAEALITHANDYRPHIMAAITREPSIRASAAYLLDAFPTLRAQEQQMLTSSFTARTRRFSRDQFSRSIFCAHEPALSWNEMLEKRLLVLIDVSKVPTAQRKFAMQWIYQSFIDWVRIESGLERRLPISLVIDELTNMLGNPADRTDPMAEALRELLDVTARNHKLWVTVMHQEENQVSPQVQLRLNGIGTQIMGVTTDPESAVRTARRYNPFDPDWIRREENVWGSRQIGDGYDQPRETEHFVLDTREVDYSIQEQLELHSRDYLEMPPFTFKIGVAKREGDTPSALRPLPTAGIDPGQFPQMEKLPLVRSMLMGRDGKALGEVLAAIDARLALAPPVAAGNRAQAAGNSVQPAGTPPQADAPPVDAGAQAAPEEPVALPYGLQRKTPKRKTT